MSINISVFWGTAKVYNAVLLIIGPIWWKTAAWSAMICSEGTEKWDIGEGIFVSALDSGSDSGRNMAHFEE